MICISLYIYKSTYMYILHVACCMLPIVYCLLPLASCLLRIAYCVLCLVKRPATAQGYAMLVRDDLPEPYKTYEQ